MTDTMTIKSDRLKAIRKGRKLGRSKLAKLAGLSERRLAKIETELTASLPRMELVRLADVLQVPEPALTGDFPLAESDLQPLAKSRCTSGCCG